MTHSLFAFLTLTFSFVKTGRLEIFNIHIDRKKSKNGNNIKNRCY